MPQFDNAYYQQLPGFYTALHPTPLKDARLLYHSEPLARELGLDESWFTPDKTPFGREKRCCPACSRWHRCTVAPVWRMGRAAGDGRGILLANRSRRTAATATGT